MADTSKALLSQHHQRKYREQRKLEKAAFKRGQVDFHLGCAAKNVSDTPEGRAYARGVKSERACDWCNQG